MNNNICQIQECVYSDPATNLCEYSCKISLKEIDRLRNTFRGDDSDILPTGHHCKVKSRSSDSSIVPLCLNACLLLNIGYIGITKQHEYSKLHKKYVTVSEKEIQFN